MLGSAGCCASVSEGLGLGLVRWCSEFGARAGSACLDANLCGVTKSMDLETTYSYEAGLVEFGKTANKSLERPAED